MPPANKRQKLSAADHKAIASTKKSEDLADSENDDSGSGSDAGDGEPSGSDEDGSPNTDDEIDGYTRPKSKNTAKRKYRATDASNLGATLQTLLSTDAPSTQPLSLKPSLARKRNDEKLELKAKKALKTEKKDKEDKGRVKDVIGGWGAESERALRKVAQRGVVKLFNAIQQSQASAAAAVEETKASRGSGKPTLPAPSFEKNIKGSKKAKNKDNPLGRGKETALGQDDFLDMIRSGVVSKA